MNFKEGNHELAFSEVPEKIRVIMLGVLNWALLSKFLNLANFKHQKWDSEGYEIINLVNNLRNSATISSRDRKTVIQ